MKIESGQVAAYRVPTDQPEESDGTAVWDSTTIVVVELAAGDVTGIGYTYSSEPAAYAAAEFIRKDVIGSDPFDIPAINGAMGMRARNMGKPGLVSTAISALDVCLWDLKAKLLGAPLVAVLGNARLQVAAYGSGGFTSYSESQLVSQLTGWADEGIGAVKMKIGREPERDLARVQAVSKELGRKAELYVDANGAYSRKQALHKAEQFGDCGVTWFEEPVTSDDRSGLRLMVERAPAVMNIAAGEYCYVLDDARLLIEARCVDVLQADVTRCGGVSGFMKIAAACEMFHMPLSAHTSPSIHAHLCCAAPAALNVEYFHDHVRIESMFFDGAIRAVNGMLKPDYSRLGLGLDFKRRDAEGYLVVELAGDQ